MKKLIIYGMILLVITMISLSCKKEKKPVVKDTFCSQARIEVSSTDDEYGKVLFSTKMNRYYIRLADLPPDDECDKYHACYPCELPLEYTKEGMIVRVTGTLEAFNKTETVPKNTCGEIPLFFKISNIRKGP